MTISRSFVVLLVLLAATMGWAQTNVSVKVACTQPVPLYSDTVIIGVNTAATNGADTLLGESWSFPPPGLGFDFRCVSYPPYDTLANDPVAGGSYVNFHKLVADGQTDWFKLGFRPDSSNSMVLSWPANLATVGAGYWVMYDDGGVTTTFGSVDMTTQTSVTIVTDPATNPPDPLTKLYYVKIKKGDALMFHTAAVNDLVSAVDSKGKPAQYEKYKPYASEAHFTFPVDPTHTAGDSILHVEYSQGIYTHFAVSSNIVAPPDDPAGKIAKFNYPVSGPLAEVSVFVKGAKGKDLIVKSYYWVPRNAPLKFKPVKLVGPAATGARLWYKMPNWNNVGFEIYTAGAGANGLTAGLTTQVGADLKSKPLFRYVYHPKWADVTKTLGFKVGGPDAAAPACLKLVNGKNTYKGFKSLAPGKGGNSLIAPMIALQFNILSSAQGHTSTGFGNLMAKASGLGLSGVTSDISVATLALLADSVLSCPDAHSPAATPAEMKAALDLVNGTFSGPFDTVGIWQTKTVLKGVKMLVSQNLMYRTTLAQPAPVTGPVFNTLAEQPVSYTLSQNYPNPFNPTTTIEFSLAKSALVTLKVYNILGQEVATLFNHTQLESGTQSVEFNANTLASGVYYYRLIVNDGQFQSVKKMMLLK